METVAFVVLLLILVWIAISLTGGHKSPPRDRFTEGAAEGVAESDIAIDARRSADDDTPCHLLEINGAAVPWSLLVDPGSKPDGAELAVFVDTESTGLSANDEIIEIALVGVFFHPANGAILGVWGRYEGQREPFCPMNPRAQAVHGISIAQLRGKRLDEQRVGEILEAADVVIAHNAPFDRRFVAKVLPAARKMEWLCSLSGIQWRNHGLPNRKLQTILKAHGVKPRAAHRALVDTVALIHVLQMEFNGKRYFAELLQQRRPRRARRAGNA